MRDVRIEPKDEGKGRTFRATLLASVEADSMWEGGLTGTDDARPVWAMFAASDAELRPFQANLATGRKIIVGKEGSHYRRRSDKIELLKTAGYQYTWQREAEGSILTACMMDLFRRDPGMVDPTGACFVVMPTEAWLASQKVDKVDEIVAHARHGFVESLLKRYAGLGDYEKRSSSVEKYAQDHGYPVTEESLRALVPLAFLFCAYLDRRIRAPLVSDGRFYLQLLLACLNAKLASWPSDPERSASYQNDAYGVNTSLRFHATDIAQVGLARPIAFKASHDQIKELLSEEVDHYFSLVGSG